MEFVKPRHIVTTDIGGDPDDEQSLTRLLVYANEVDIEGIIPHLFVDHTYGRKGKIPLDRPSQLEICHEAIRRYGQCLENLRGHDAGYPDADALHAVVKAGHVEVPHGGKSEDPMAVAESLVGEGQDTAGSDWIIEAVDRDDERPVTVSVWGGPADIAQALWKVRATRSAGELAAFLAKIRVHAIGDQDDTGPWIRENFPTLFYIRNLAGDGQSMHSCFRGMFYGGDMELTSLDWVTENVLEGHGPLGAWYPTKTWTWKNPHGCLKEGDTPSWFYFLNNGLNVPEEPEAGGWGGRFVRKGHQYFDAMDTVGDETSHWATTWRWRPAFQNDWAARMDWCVKGPGEANHAPVAIVNGQGGRGVVRLRAKAGEDVTVDASGSTDPDGDDLDFRWWVYLEASSYGGEVAVESSDRPVATVRVPEDAGGKEIHVIFEVTDGGHPRLTSYRRVVVAVE